MVRDEEAALLAKRALEAVAPSMKELSEETDLEYATLRAWKAGTRSPSPENMKRIARMLDNRADSIRGLSLELRKLADSSENDDS